MWKCCWVPQGSILGLIMFLLYINELVYIVPAADFTIYADDTSLLVYYKNQDQINKCTDALEKISTWFFENSLSLNTSQTYCVQFRKRQKNLIYIYNYTCKFFSKMTNFYENYLFHSRNNLLSICQNFLGSFIFGIQKLYLKNRRQFNLQYFASCSFTNCY